MEQLLNRKTVRGRTYYLVRWQGHASAADSWEPAEHLANCQPEERVAEYEAAAPRRPKALRAYQHASTAPLAMAAPPSPPPPSAAAPPPKPPPGWDVAAAGPPDLGSALLYWWPDEG